MKKHEVVVWAGIADGDGNGIDGFDEKYEILANDIESAREQALEKVWEKHGSDLKCAASYSMTTKVDGGPEVHYDQNPGYVTCPTCDGRGMVKEPVAEEAVSK